MSSAFRPTRRHAIAGAAAALAYAGLKPYAWAAGKSGLHALSIFGEFKYPPNFTQFDWVNAKAPKAGRVSYQPPNWTFNQSTDTFNTLNSFVLKNDAPPRIELIFDTLMTGAADEPDTMYCRTAESVAVSEDANVYTFTLRSAARFHDGTPLTAADVAFSLNLLKDKGHPNIQEPLLPVAKAEAADARTLVITLNGKQNRETILTVAGLPIFSKAYYTAHDFDAASLDPPLGSGPYKVGKVNAPSSIEYQRVPDYWGKDLPVNVGLYNFDIIHIDFYRDRQPAFEALKKGDTTIREEFTSKTWALEYNFPAVVDGKVKKTLVPNESVPSQQGWFFNTRKAKFGDPRTRLALGLAFDFEWTNRNLFYDAYIRNASYFEKSDFAATGKPTPAELALLEPFRADLPAGVFTDDAYVPPKSDGSGSDRNLLRRASQLLTDAGWKASGGKMVDAKGQTLDIEFLIDSEVFVTSLSPFIENLKRIGVTASTRLVDPSQYQSRLKGFDYDVVSAAFTFSPTPIDGMNQFFSSKAADDSGSYNFSGIKEKAVDALLAKLAGVNSREELVAILRSIDRVLRAKQYWIANWYSPNHRVAHWDLFGRPDNKPPYGFAPEVTWWFDAAKAAAIGRPNG